MKRVAAIIAAGYVLVGLLMFVPVWWLSQLEHFRVQYLLGGIPVVVIAWWSRMFDAALISWLLDLAIVAPHMHGPAAARDGAHVRVLYANVLASNTHFDRVRALIAETNPDIIALVETRAPWFAQIAPAVEGYERLEHDRNDNFGLGLYVRGRLAGRVEALGGELPTIVATVELADVKFTMLVTHPWPPMNSWARERQHEHLAAVAHRIRGIAGPIVLAGDLNATPWSRVFRKLVGTTGLCDTRTSYQGSWPADDWLLRVPIDHVLVSCSIGVRDRWIGPDIGSDHLPVVADLAFPLQ